MGMVSFLPVKPAPPVGIFPKLQSETKAMLDILILIVLTLLNSLFALSEIALVSVKKNRMLHLADQGSTAAKSVLALIDHPENFLSSIQVGITLIGIISGAYGGANLSDDLARLLKEYEAVAPYADNIAFVLVIGLITFFSIVVGELTPKSIGIKYAERIALTFAPFIQIFSKVTSPLVRLFSASTRLILLLFGIHRGETEEKITEEEIKFLLKSAGKQGALDPEEIKVHNNLLSFSDQIAKSLMTHRTDIDWIDINDDLPAIREQILKSVHSKFPVGRDSLDELLGVISSKDFLSRYSDPGFTLDSILQKPLYFTFNTSVYHMLERFRSEKKYTAIVVDEYGGVEGLLTLHDLIEAIVGNLPEQDEEAYDIVPRDDGSLLIDGKLLVNELNIYLQEEVIENNPSAYTTVAGFFLESLDESPTVGKKVQFNHYVLELIDMDGPRIDKLLLSKVAPKVEASEE